MAADENPKKNKLANVGHSCTSRTSYTFATSAPLQFNLMIGVET